MEWLCGEKNVKNVNKMPFACLICFVLLNEKASVSAFSSVRSDIVGCIAGLKLDEIAISEHLRKPNKPG